MARITISELYTHYGAYLRAKVQLAEFQAWGISETFTKTIADYEALEAAFVQQMLADRRAGDVEFKKKTKL